MVANWLRGVWSFFAMHNHLLSKSPRTLWNWFCINTMGMLIKPHFPSDNVAKMADLRSLTHQIGPRLFPLVVVVRAFQPLVVENLGCESPLWY